MTGGDQITYLHVDHLNTPRTGTDEFRSVVWSWESEPFGNSPATASIGSQGFVVAVNLRFPGQQFDAETGLHYNYFRTYDPSTGRYIQSDPIGLAGGLNAYGYVENNPISFIDPLGLIKLPNNPSGLPSNWNPDPSHRDPNGERWTNGTDVLDFHRVRPGKLGWRGKDHWHHNEGDKHYSPGEECPTSDDAPAEDQEFMERMSEVTGLTGSALVIYLIISEGSRAFPPRNLVPVP